MHPRAVVVVKFGKETFMSSKENWETRAKTTEVKLNYDAVWREATGMYGTHFQMSQVVQASVVLIS